MSRAWRILLAILVTTSAGSAGCGGDDGKPSVRSQELLEAAAAGDIPSIRGLLAGGADIEVRDPQGRTPLIVAAAAKRNDAVLVLLSEEADVNATDARGDTAYPIAVLSNNPELVGVLLDFGANRIGTKAFGGTPLIAAADRGYVDVVRTILQRPDIPIDHVNDLGWTALLEAIILGDGGPAHTQIVDLLVDAGANVNLADREGVTPLQHAKRRGYTAMVRRLAAAGAR